MASLCIKKFEPERDVPLCIEKLTLTIFLHISGESQVFCEIVAKNMGNQDVEGLIFESSDKIDGFNGRSQKYYRDTATCNSFYRGYKLIKQADSIFTHIINGERLTVRGLEPNLLHAKPNEIQFDFRDLREFKPYPIKPFEEENCCYGFWCSWIQKMCFKIENGNIKLLYNIENDDKIEIKKVYVFIFPPPEFEFEMSSNPQFSYSSFNLKKRNVFKEWKPIIKGRAMVSNRRPLEHNENGFYEFYVSFISARQKRRTKFLSHILVLISGFILGLISSPLARNLENTLSPKISVFLLIFFILIAISLLWKIIVYRRK